MKKKLLHIALGSVNKGLWKAFDNHFDTLHYDWKQDSNNIDSINIRIQKLHTDFNPDYVFMQIQREGIIHPNTAKKLTSTSYTMNWTGDVRYPLPQWFVDLGKNISITLFSNMQDVLLSRKAGINSDFLQVGFDEQIFRPNGVLRDNAPIVFMGSNYEGTNHKFPLTQFRINIVKELNKEFGNDFEVYGSNWNNYVSNPKHLGLNEESLTYRSCKIAINLSHFNYGRYSSDRLIRLMGSGAFCLSHNYQGIENDFKIKKHLDIWNDIDELIEKIKYYLHNDYERDLIAKEGCKFVRENCTWDKRMSELKNYILL